ncbi:MAG: S49 family peptidase [Alphaproteobacteria bacterium]|jgi:serine protease SohB|nr:S49 family peptidase [Alphaproteobacteria bacterium]
MFKKSKKQISVLKLYGVINKGGKKSLYLAGLKKNIDKAFECKKTVAVALLINSPGGSPAQSEMIANYVREKSRETKIPVISFVEDVAASGGYWLALAGEDIYALSKSSIVGSLGVLSAGFGLEDFIKKHGITRRVYTAGKNKVSNDPFQAEKEEDIARMRVMLAEIHKHFKDWVLSRREGRLKISEEDLFSGEYWVASQGLPMGLIDDIVVSMEHKLHELYGDKVKINYIEAKKGFLSSLLSAKASMAEEAIAEIKDVGVWNKFGL